MSKFDIAIDALKTHLLDQEDSLTNKGPRQWLTTLYESYEALEDVFDSEEANEEFQKLYQECKELDTGGNIGEEQGYRLQVAIISAFRRSARWRMIAGVEMRRKARQDFDRYATQDIHTTEAFLNRIQQWVNAKTGK